MGRKRKGRGRDAPGPRVFLHSICAMSHRFSFPRSGEHHRPHLKCGLYGACLKISRPQTRQNRPTITPKFNLGYRYYPAPGGLRVASKWRIGWWNCSTPPTGRLKSQPSKMKAKRPQNRRQPRRRVQYPPPPDGAAGA